MTTEQKADFRQAALDYHAQAPAGKLAIQATKPLINQRDLSLAYSPGVAAPCEEIVRDPASAFTYTARGNLVAVISNGTAVLGLGDIGPLASKPVMEGKAVLFKKFAGVDVFDIEIAEKDPARLVDVISALEPTFGAINLEDIKAPDCFFVERELRKRLKIPVFHDDQHGTAITVAAAMLNGLAVAGKEIGQVKLVASGAGAAALACLDLLLKLGLRRENVFVTDLAGVVHEGRTALMDDDKRRYMQKTDARTLDDVIAGADVFLGLSAGGVLKPSMVAKMASRPIVFALANPNPEIMPADAHAVRDDVIMATGRADYPNQVNNVLCFPYIFRGALDAGATTITDEMEIAAVDAIAELARAEQSERVAAAYVGEKLVFGAEYLIPKPFDPRLMTRIAPAVAQAAADSGVATRPFAALRAYRARLEGFVYASGTTMKPIFDTARQASKKRVVYCEGEEERVLRAAQIVVDEGIARPTLIGRPKVIVQRIEKFGLRLREGADYDIVDVGQDARDQPLRQGRPTLIGATLLRAGDVDGMICGTSGTTHAHLHDIDQVIGKRAGGAESTAQDVPVYACMNGLVLPDRQVFLVDTHVNADPTPEELAEITVLAAEEMRRFGIVPKAALLSHSNFGSSDLPSAIKMRRTLAVLREQAPWLEVDGEMHGDVALDGRQRATLMPNSPLTGDANLLVFPTLDAANIAYNLLKTAAGGNIAIGPVLLGAAQTVHILTPSATVRRIVNMSALVVADANAQRVQGAGARAGAGESS